MRILLILLSSLVLLCSCSGDDANTVGSNDSVQIIKAVDISAFPKIEASGFIYKNQDGLPESMLDIVKGSGVNTVRLRLWVNPINGHSGFDEVLRFSSRLKAEGFKIWIALHYSDTWADPGNQQTPVTWQNLDVSDLKTMVYDYTSRVVREIDPDFIQIGNEINSGILHPLGDLGANETGFLNLLQAGINAVRDADIETEIILHFAGHDNADWFFNKMDGLDYDIIGLSYYPLWHGKSLTGLENSLKDLSVHFEKPVLIAETAYPFTLGFNDFTNNIVGLDNQLILPEYPALPSGQKSFIQAVKNMSLNNEGILGFCYWGAELVAWDGTQSTAGSPWENQALFDFQGRALPVLEVFKD